MKKLFFIAKEEHRTNDGKYTEYAEPIDYFTNWIYDEVMSDNFYDDEDRANCYFELDYVNYDGKIETDEKYLRLPISLNSAFLLRESEWKNIDLSLYTIIGGGKEEVMGAVPSFYEFMTYAKSCNEED